MCAEYFANKVGWYDKAFALYDIPSQENYIHEKLDSYGGTTFYPNSSNGAPKSISRFLYGHLNITNENMALLNTSYFCEEYTGALLLIMNQIRYEKKPLISVVSEAANAFHAVVITGYQEDSASETVKKVFYNDPWYGNRNKSKFEWQRYSCISDVRYMTLYFDDYNK